MCAYSFLAFFEVPGSVTWGFVNATIFVRGFPPCLSAHLECFVHLQITVRETCALELGRRPVSHLLERRPWRLASGRNQASLSSGRTHSRPWPIRRIFLRS